MFSVAMKVKFTLEQVMKAEREGGRNKAMLFPNLVAKYGGWSSTRAKSFNPQKENRYPFYRRVLAQGQSGRVQKPY